MVVQVQAQNARNAKVCASTTSSLCKSIFYNLLPSSTSNHLRDLYQTGKSDAILSNPTGPQSHIQAYVIQLYFQIGCLKTRLQYWRNYR